MLNEKNEYTEKVIHLMVTSLCKRDCPYCCNKQYDLNSIPYVTDEELSRCHTLCITGGEPFAFANPSEIAKYYKEKYKNIKNVYVYTNAYELYNYMNIHNGSIYSIDGLNISIKDKRDLVVFDHMLYTITASSKLSNRLYVFNDLMPKNTEGVNIIKREWQKEFVPADDSIFRKI